MYNSSTTPVTQTLAELSSIVENLLLLLSEKEKSVIKKRFSLCNERKHTLEEIGQEFFVTRERIRQIEKNALMKMKRNVFNTSLRHLHDYISSSVRAHGGLVREDVLIDDVSKVVSPNNKFDEDGLHLAFVLHESLDCVGNTIDFHPYVREMELPNHSLKVISGKLINQLNKYGDVKDLGKIHNDLKGVCKDFEYDLSRIKSLVRIDKRLTLLDDDLVGLLEWRHIYPRTLRDKILYILRQDNEPLHFTDIAKKIEGAKFDKRSINLQAVHNELIRNNNFVLIGRGIYALKDWGYETGTVAEVVRRILKEHDELSEEEILKKVFDQRKVKKITILLALKNGKKFERVGRKRYRLKNNK